MVLSEKLLNKDKTRFTLFHRSQYRDHLPLRLPDLKVNDYEMKGSSSIKFFRSLVEEHLSGINHITTLENKLSKNLGLLHKPKPFLKVSTSPFSIVT